MSETSAADILEELEIPWLSEMIANSVAQLGYPVGCGVAPKPEHLEHAAKLLFARYKSMIAAVEAGRVKPALSRATSGE